MKNRTDTDCPLTAKPVNCSVLENSDTLEVRYNRILRHSHEEIYVFVDGTLIFTEVSEGSLNNLGYTMDEIKRMSPVDLEPLITASEFNTLIQPLRDGTENILCFQTMHERKDGSTYDVDVRLQYVDGLVPEFIAMVTDITERNQYEEELKALAFRDPGTDLYNRRFFLEQLAVTIDNTNRRASIIGLIIVDMDNLSFVNNSLGHLAGDKVILDVAKKIKTVFSRRSDIVARYGGDEFVVMCIDTDEADLIVKCHELKDLFNVPTHYEEHELIQTASIGICVANGKDSFVTVEGLIQGADDAMYASKAAGKNTVTVSGTCK